MNSNEEYFAKIYIRADTRKMEIKRKYQTVLEFISDTFYFWELVFLICNIIFKAYNKTSLNYYLENELFFFKGKNNHYLNTSSESNKNIAKNILNRIGPLNILQYKELSIMSEDIDSHNASFENRYNFKKSKVVVKSNCKQIIFVFRQIVKFFKCKCRKCKKCKICKKSKREIIISKAKKIINNKLDIIIYFKNMFLLDIFHYLIDKNRKRGIFNFLSIPNISPDIDDDEEYYYIQQGEHFTKDNLKILSDEIFEATEQKRKKVRLNIMFELYQ